MKVVYLSPSGQMGGAETSLLTLLGGLLQQNPEFRPYVIAPEAGPFIGRCGELGIPYEILSMPARMERVGDSATADRLALLGRAADLVRGSRDLVNYTKALRALLRREQPDLIHTNGFKMHIVGAWVKSGRGKRGAPLVGHIHDYVSTRPLAGRLLKVGSSRFAEFIANSRSVAADVEAFLRPQHVSTVYNAVDLTRFTPGGSVTDLDALCGLPAGVLGVVRVGLIATFAKWKGHVTFLRALARLNTVQPVRGYIIGGPIYKRASSQFSIEDLRTEASRLGVTDRVGFTGFVNDVPGAMRALDVVVHASTQPEPFGMTIIEAMACERAVIVSNLGGAQELFAEGVSGLGHVAGDECAMAAAIERLIENAPLRAQMARRAREHVTLQFPVSAMARQVWTIYNDSVARSRSFTWN